MLRITAYGDGDWRSVPLEALEGDFLEICEAHRAQGRALAFAVILFDRSHPYVRSALAQQHYWDALHVRSGRLLSVFSLDARSGNEGRPIEKRGMHSLAGPSFDRLTQALSGYFEGLIQVTLPCVLFFQVAEGKVIDQLAVTLPASGLSETYEELEAVIGTAADAVSRVTDENAENAHEIFNLIEVALNGRSERLGVVRVYRAVQTGAEFLAVGHFIRVVLDAVAR